MTPTNIERTPDGRRTCVSREVVAPASDAWDLLVDTYRWPEWGPTVSAVDCDDRRIARGTRGRVQVLGGLWVPFEITSCGGRRWTWDVARLPATGHSVTALDATRCRVRFEVPLLASGYAPVCARALRTIESILETEQ